MQMTNNGTGVYYRPLYEININSQVIGDIGMHFNNNNRPIANINTEISNQIIQGF